MKKIFFLIPVFILAANTLFAQDDELPPPSSNPKSDTLRRINQQPPDASDFQGFKAKKKFDLSKFIIEPNFNLSITPGSIDIGVSPYVGYKIFEPEKSKANGKNTGLFVGGGLIYRFAQVRAEAAYGGQIYYGKGKFHTYGGGVFLQYNIWKSFFARAKFELVHRSGDDLFQTSVNVIQYPNGSYEMKFPKLDKTIPALLIGVGFNLLRSKNFFMPAMISYDVLHSVVQQKYSLYPRGLVVQLGFINIF